MSVDGEESEILRDLAFTLQAGTFTCLIGPSGCGKTTTLRILLGLDHDFSGTVTMPAGDVRTVAVFQEPRLLPWRTVEQNVRLALPPGATPDIQPLFTTLGLQAMLDRYPSELSLGLERRVALARAFAVMPDVLLLDEPFVSLDEHTAERLRELLVELWQRHAVTVLMVTHNVREAVQLADRLLLMNGRPAKIVGDVAVPMERSKRSGVRLQQFLDELTRNHAQTVRA
ncbi:ABC transporter ATP-binding protein [Chelativorans salis]|uniref:ABC transporter ATP-binding protein n=1 Tax=Chelativorans salis TaxID=2978478 RepID=A0ABT2LIE4_9HYPH|nr:ABC transporter ATP-binding protein [Chelativorans sp. EGI FJ00035]MCT7374280.1 ABC transporter ATP-binding protein [Chelativorans sp. EGI FJ00035]